MQLRQLPDRVRQLEKDPLEVPTEVFQLVVAYLLAEMARGDLLNLMGFVENEDRIIRQYLPHLIHLQGEVGKKERMVDYDDVRFKRPLAHAGDIAPIEVSALLPHTGFASGIQGLPQRVVIAHPVQLGSVAAFRLLNPTGK